MALTNASSFYNALRANDRRLFVAVHDPILTTGGDISEKRANCQTAFRDKRQKRLSGSDIEKRLRNIKFIAGSQINN